MQTYNFNYGQNLMPLLMNFTTPTPIQDITPDTLSYDETNQVTYDMRTVGTKSLRYVATKIGGKNGCTQSDPKNVLDDEKSV